MVKHKQFDNEIIRRSFYLANSDAKQDVPCFRCSHRKSTARFGFCNTPEGKKMICGGCYDELVKKKEKTKRKLSKREGANKKLKTAENEEGQFLCPILLELFEKKGSVENIDELEFIEIFPQNIKAGNSNHYWELVSNLMMRLKFPFSLMETNEQEYDLDNVLKILDVVFKAKENFSEEKKKLIEKAKRILDFQKEKQEHVHEWTDLKSLEDLRKLRACLEDVKNLDKISKTLTDLIDSFVQKISEEPENNSLKTDFWNCITAVGKLGKSKKDVLSESQLSNARVFLGNSLEKLSKIYSEKQKQRIKEDLESIK